MPDILNRFKESLINIAGQFSFSKKQYFHRKQWASFNGRV